MSYNVLSPTLLNDDIKLFTKSELPYIKWEYRVKLIQQEIMYFKPDIITFQEVDEDDTILQS